jgi:DNA-binding transcriptional MerR regulator
MNMERSHLSIGEVLALLQQEFPDVTISKIRFLESQGLVDPERTPSGYRKFYENDVERLRWILRQQRENFLPLKVIKDKLSDGTGLDAEVVPMDLERANPDRGAPVPTDRSAPSGPVAPEPAAGPASMRPAPAASGMEASQTAETAGRREGTAVMGLDSDWADASLTGEELAEATGASEMLIHDLDSFGMIDGDRVGGEVYYGPEALDVARIAVAFARYGVEPRHLRLYLTAAQREAAFLDQIVVPLRMQRNPEARQRATRAVQEMTELGQNLRALLLARELRD